MNKGKKEGLLWCRNGYNPLFSLDC